MRLRPLRVEVAAVSDDSAGGGTWERPWDGGTCTTRLGPVELQVEGCPPSLLPGEYWRGYSWSVGNVSDRPVDLLAVRLVFRVEFAGELRVFRHGWQSWSPCDVATLGVDEDPSRDPRVPALVRGMHHADEERAAHLELRSELVTLLADERDLCCLGFLGGSRHDGTFRVRPAEDPGQDGGEVVCEAYLGGARFASSEERRLHELVVSTGEDHHELLVAWASSFAAAAGVDALAATVPVGWCSWYHYFHDLSEDDVLSNLALAGDWPFEIFQVDDGFQRRIGEWTQTCDRFPGGLERLADRIATAGFTPGLWIAPFLASPESEPARRPGWTAMRKPGRELVGMVNQGWGGVVFALDTTNPDVLDHLTQTVRELVGMGWRYLKLDFTYSPSLRGTWNDPSLTPAQRVRAGFEAIRRGAGDDTFLLGCGAPLGAAAGLVDGMRIGPDVAPNWEPSSPMFPAYAAAEPAVVNAWRNTLARSFQHRRLWVSDPDCLMLRSEHTSLDPEATGSWARAVAASGGAVFVSDDLSLLGVRERRLFEKVVATAKEVDRLSHVRPPECEDLLEGDLPRRLTCDGFHLVGVPEKGRANLDRWDRGVQGEPLR